MVKEMPDKEALSLQGMSSYVHSALTQPLLSYVHLVCRFIAHYIFTHALSHILLPTLNVYMWKYLAARGHMEGT